MTALLSFVGRWTRGETRWNAPVCFTVSLLCAFTALLVAAVAPRWDIVGFNLVLSVVNLAMFVYYRAHYREFCKQQKHNR
jgi:hypothetical protein